MKYKKMILNQLGNSADQARCNVGSAASTSGSYDACSLGSSVSPDLCADGGSATGGRTECDPGGSANGSVCDTGTSPT